MANYYGPTGPVYPGQQSQWSQFYQPRPPVYDTSPRPINGLTNSRAWELQPLQPQITYYGENGAPTATSQSQPIITFYDQNPTIGPVATTATPKWQPSTQYSGPGSNYIPPIAPPQQPPEQQNPDDMPVPEYFYGLYPQMPHGMTMGEFKNGFLPMLQALGAPYGWNNSASGGAGSGIGYSQLAWDQQKWNAEFPEQQRQWNAQFGQNVNQSAMDERYRNAQMTAQQAQAAQQMQLNRDQLTAQQEQWLKDYQSKNAQQQIANQQWGQQFGEAKRQNDIGQSNWYNQYQEGQRQFNVGQGNTERQFGENQFQANNQNMFNERQLRQAQIAADWQRQMEAANMANQKDQFEKSLAAQKETAAMQTFGRRFAPNISAM